MSTSTAPTGTPGSDPAPSRNLFSLESKVDVITGSSRGISRAIAERMAEHGARVVISSRKLDACQAVVDEIERRHGAGHDRDRVRARRLTAARGATRDV